MRAKTIAKGTLHTILWIVLGIVLVAIGAILMVYSPWMQRLLKEKAVAWLNSKPGMEVAIDSFQLKYPLSLDISGLQLIQDGDTLVAAEHAMVKARLLPLLKGEVGVEKLELDKARYQMGNADSLMMILIKADTLNIAPGSVRLAPMKINIDDGYISRGLVALYSRPDTAPAKPAPEATPLDINVKNLRLRDFTYQMQLLPTIDSLGARIGEGTAQGIAISLTGQTVKVGSFTGSHLNASYIAPDSAQIASAPIVPIDSAALAAKPWTVTIDTIGFRNSKGLYTTKGYQPLPGLDFGYIQADSLAIEVKDFYNQATTLRLPIKIDGVERCGVHLMASGTLDMDSAAMRFVDFNVATVNDTHLHADGLLGVGDLISDSHLPLSLQAYGELAVPDVRLMFPMASPLLAGVNQAQPIDLDANIYGTSGNISIEKLKAELPGCLSLSASGNVEDAFLATGPSGNVKFSGSIINVKSIVKDMLAGTGITVPPMTVSGNVDMHSGTIQGKAVATALDGTVSAQGTFNATREAYQAHVAASRFPLNAFMPEMGVGRLTAQVDAKGQGFNFFSRRTTLYASAKVGSLQYNGYNYQGIDINAQLADGHATATAKSASEDLDVDIHAEGNLIGDTYAWTANVDAQRVDLYALGFMPEEGVLMLQLNADAEIDPSSKEIEATASLRHLTLTQEAVDYDISNVKATFSSSDSITAFDLVNRDFIATATIPYGLDSIAPAMQAFTTEFDRQMALHELHVDTLQKVLPKFNVYVSAGNDNFINDILSQHDMQIQRLSLTAKNEKTIGMRARVVNFNSGSTRIDSIGATLHQHGDSMHLIARMNNRPGTFDDFAHVRLDAIASANALSLHVNQKNIGNQTGFDIGTIVTLADSTVALNFYPLNPVIGYKNWTLNDGNYVKYNFPKRLVDADLNARSDMSSLTFSSIPHDSIGSSDINLKISDIFLQDWIAINPFAPPIAGTLSADLNLKWDGNQSINGDGFVTLNEFKYDKQKVGDFTTHVDVTTNTAGSVRANADLYVNNEKTVTLSGCLNDSTTTSPFNLDLSLIKFPLNIVNPFLPADMASLSGTLNGSMDVSGDATQPLLNGEIYFQDAAVRAVMTNTSYAISDVKIPVDSSLVRFNDFNIRGTNENPLFVNGTVDVTHLMSPRIALDLRANNMMIVNSNRAARGADIYGKAYISLDASLKGNMRFMRANADLKLLAGTNVTYVLSTPAAAALQAPTETDMVKFVNLNDTLATVMADTISDNTTMMAIDATLQIQNGTTITVELGGNARDKVQLQTDANLNYTQLPMSDGRLMGRININGGFARYTLPVIGSEKTFNFDEGSYVAFNGDILNPTINVHATDPVKANVTHEGQNSRIVDFDVLLAITGTLSTLDVAFDLTTNDDLTVANELQSMTAEQRANQAMNLLLYNMYTGPGTTGNANLSAGPLYSFLTSQLNNWAASNIKGVDLSFGIDQYNQTINGSTSSTMNYSYQVSKTLFNDRFKIVVGGNYSTDDSSEDNLSENLISDISLEYYLNAQRTMMLKIFRHTGYESILEGEVTQTGVGFVYKRKVNRLVQILPRFMRPRKYRLIR